jgi:hypothetical protein
MNYELRGLGYVDEPYGIIAQIMGESREIGESRRGVRFLTGTFFNDS